MNKTELIDHIAKQADISKAAAGRALEAIVAWHTEQPEEGQLGDAGRLRYVRGRQARGAYRSQSAHERGDQDQGGQGAEIPPRQGAERFAKLARFAAVELLRDAAARSLRAVEARNTA